MEQEREQPLIDYLKALEEIENMNQMIKNNKCRVEREKLLDIIQKYALLRESIMAGNTTILHKFYTPIMTCYYSLIKIIVKQEMNDISVKFNRLKEELITYAVGRMEILFFSKIQEIKNMLAHKRQYIGSLNLDILYSVSRAIEGYMSTVDELERSFRPL